MRTISEIMETFNITQKQISDRFNIPYRTVQNWVASGNNKRECPEYVVSMMEDILKKEYVMRNLRRYIVLEFCEGFMVEISDGEAWIYHNDYGVKSLMFGVENVSDEEMIEIVEANVDDYIETYKEEYMD